MILLIMIERFASIFFVFTLYVVKVFFLFTHFDFLFRSSFCFFSPYRDHDITLVRIEVLFCM